MEWEAEYGEDSGEFTFPVTTTGRTIRYKDYFPPSTRGRTLQRTFKRDEATSSSVEIKEEEIRYFSEPMK